MKELIIKSEAHKGDVKAAIDKLDLTVGKTYRIQITTKRKIRTISQNALYWLWLTCIEQETGNAKEYLHEYFKQEFLGREIVMVFNAEVYPLKTTTGLNTKQFTNYLEKMKVFASVELGITLPLPFEKHFNDFYNQYINEV
jgi:hypothetical protein